MRGGGVRGRSEGEAEQWALFDMWPTCLICQHNKKIIADKHTFLLLLHCSPLKSTNTCLAHLPATRIKISHPLAHNPPPPLHSILPPSSPLLHYGGVCTAPAPPLTTMCSPGL